MLQSKRRMWETGILPECSYQLEMELDWADSVPDINQMLDKSQQKKICLWSSLGISDCMWISQQIKPGPHYLYPTKLKASYWPCSAVCQAQTMPIFAILVRNRLPYMDCISTWHRSYFYLRESTMYCRASDNICLHFSYTHWVSCHYSMIILPLWSKVWPKISPGKVRQKQIRRLFPVNV